MMRTPAAMYARIRAHHLGGPVLDALRPLCPETVVYQSLDAAVWHVSACPLLRTPFAHLRCSFENLPPDHELCRSCGSWRQLPHGKVLLVLDELCDAADTQLDWRGVSRRRRIALEPFPSFPVRVTGAALFWPTLRTALEPMLAALDAEARAAARQLEVTELFEAAIAHRLERCNESGYSPASRWLDSAGASESTFRPTRAVNGSIRALCAVKSVPVLLAATDLALFAHGDPVSRLIDLMTLTTTLLSPNAALLDLPPAVVVTLQEHRAVDVIPLPPTASRDVDALRWAVRLYLAAPHRTLAAAYDAARRLTSTRVPA